VETDLVRNFFLVSTEPTRVSTDRTKQQRFFMETGDHTDISNSADENGFILSEPSFVTQR
jgi:hypothetical protein